MNKNLYLYSSLFNIIFLYYQDMMSGTKTWLLLCQCHWSERMINRQGSKVIKKNNITVLTPSLCGCVETQCMSNVG